MKKLLLSLMVLFGCRSVTTEQYVGEGETKIT